MKKDDWRGKIDGVINDVIYVITALFFGLWQESFTAGLFMLWVFISIRRFEGGKMFKDITEERASLKSRGQRD